MGGRKLPGRDHFFSEHGQGLSPAGDAVYRRVREQVAFMEKDRELWPDIQAVEAMVRSGELLELVPWLE